MLKINKRTRKFSWRLGLSLACGVTLIGGCYLLVLIFSPAAAPVIAVKPIDVKSLPAPQPTEDRIIIPKIGVDIPYAEGAAALDRGAQWRYPDRGNPADGGNFIIAAHRFSIQPTPSATIEKSPFYHIDKLAVGDKIIIDYKGKRYAYEIDQQRNVTPDQVEIEAPSDSPKLTLYSCTLGGSSDGRVVLISKRLGEVALSDVSASH